MWFFIFITQAVVTSQLGVQGIWSKTGNWWIHVSMYLAWKHQIKKCTYDRLLHQRCLHQLKCSGKGKCYKLHDDWCVPYFCNSQIISLFKDLPSFPEDIRTKRYGTRESIAASYRYFVDIFILYAKKLIASRWTWSYSYKKNCSLLPHNTCNIIGWRGGWKR